MPEQDLIAGVEKILHKFILAEAEQFDRINKKEMRTDQGYTKNRLDCAKEILEYILRYA